MHFRSNEERLKRLKKVLSFQSRQYRARRIKINLIINGIAYMAEVLGTIVIIVLGLPRYPAFLRRIIITNIGTGIWYAIIIPSCYLMNSNEIKDSIMENGWTNIIKDIYAKKTRRYVPNSPNRKVQNAGQSINDNPENSLNKRKQFTKPSDSQSNSGFAQIDDTPSESASGRTVNKTKNELRNGLIIHDLETGHLERHFE